MSKYNKKILGVITARGGSKGIPGKNIKLLGGKPLIFYTINIAKKSKLITDLILSTDDQKIASVARKYVIEVPFLRPKRLATDTSSHLEVIKHALDFMETKNNTVYDYVVILQPTSPFRTAEDIDQTIKKLIKHDADSSFSMCKIDPSHHPIKVKRMLSDKVLPYAMDEKIGTRRQDLSIAYKRSGAVYVTKRSLITKGYLFGDNSVGYIVDRDRSIDIDTEFDWLMAEYMYIKLKEQKFFD